MAMVNREKNLMFLVGGLAVVLVGYWGSQQYLEAKRGAEAKYDNTCKELKSVQQRKQNTIRQTDQWRSLGKQTLSADLSEAKTLLRDDLSKLAVECGLKAATVRIETNTDRLGSPTRDRPETVRTLSANVTAQGSTEMVTRFLYRLHARPYLVRLKTLTLSLPHKGEPGELSVSSKVEALLLPQPKLVRGFTPANLDIKESEETPRTIAQSFDDYRATILKRKPFQPSQEIRLAANNPNPANNQSAGVEVKTVDLRWAPDPAKDASYVTAYEVHTAKNSPTNLELLAEVSKSVTHARWDGLEVGPRYYWRVDTKYVDWEGEEQTTQGPVWSFTVQKKPEPPPVTTRPVQQGPIVKPPPPPPPDADFTLASVVSSPAAQYVIIQDRRQANNPNAPEKKVELGEELYGGTLVYLDPRGAVSGLPKDNPTEFRFHPMGQPLKSGLVPLKDRNGLYGDVYIELVKLREKAQGITQAPGDRPETGS